MSLLRTRSKEEKRIPDLLTIPRAARRLGVGRRQLYRAVSQGELPAYRAGGWRRVCWLEVLAWTQRQRVPVTRHAEQRVAEILAGEAGRDY